MKFGPDMAASSDTELKMTPMIDVVFQLLIFFLVGTKFRVPEGELEAYLPRDEGPPTKKSEVIDVREIRVTLMVSQSGERNPNVPPAIRLDDTEVGSQTDSGTSMRWLERKLYLIVGTNKAMLQKVPVIIEAEPHLAYRWVIATLDLCRKIGFHKVNFAASKRNAPEPEKKAGGG